MPNMPTIGPYSFQLMASGYQTIPPKRGRPQKLSSGVKGGNAPSIAPPVFAPPKPRNTTHTEAVKRRLLRAAQAQSDAEMASASASEGASEATTDQEAEDAGPSTRRRGTRSSTREVSKGKK